MLFYLLFLLCAIQCDAMNDWSFLNDWPFSQSINANEPINLDINDYNLLCGNFSLYQLPNPVEIANENILQENIAKAISTLGNRRYKHSQIRKMTSAPAAPKISQKPVKPFKGTRGRKGSKYQHSNFACIICSLRFKDQSNYHAHSLQNETHKNGMHDKVYGDSCAFCNGIVN